VIFSTPRLHKLPFPMSSLMHLRPITDPIIH
jgi:hypothetical protein